MPKRNYKRSKPIPDLEPQQPSRYVQLDLLEAIAQVERLKADTQADVNQMKRDGRYDDFFRDLLGSHHDEPAPAPIRTEPIVGRLYVGRTINHKEYSGYYRYTTGSGLWCLCDSDNKPIALVVPASAREIPE